MLSYNEKLCLAIDILGIALQIAGIFQMANYLKVI